jgi:hypothetical protein
VGIAHHYRIPTISKVGGAHPTPLIKIITDKNKKPFTAETQSAQRKNKVIFVNE